MKFMLVDDSNAMRRIQKNVLEKLGIADIVEACDGKDAFEKVIDNPPDVMLLDVNMPRMDGFELLKNLRGMDKFSSIKIIMCTSESEKSKIMEAIKLGANNYVVKPFTPDVLKEKLKDMKLL